jgi:hypothetical protein
LWDSFGWETFIGSMCIRILDDGSRDTGTYVYRKYSCQVLLVCGPVPVRWSPAYGPRRVSFSGRQGSHILPPSLCFYRSTIYVPLTDFWRYFQLSRGEGESLWAWSLKSAVMLIRRDIVSWCRPVEALELVSFFFYSSMQLFQGLPYIFLLENDTESLTIFSPSWRRFFPWRTIFIFAFICPILHLFSSVLFIFILFFLRSSFLLPHSPPPFSYFVIKWPGLISPTLFPFWFLSFFLCPFSTHIYPSFLV